MISPKKGLCGGLSEINDIFDKHGNVFCLPDNAIFHDWRVGAYQDGNISKVPFVWSASNVASFQSAYPDGYDALIYFANEPTLPTQSWISAETTAKIAADINKIAPKARLVGPHHHPTINAPTTPKDWMARFYYKYLELGGDPDAIHANAFHVYYHSSMLDPSPSAMIETYYSLLPMELQRLRLHVSECGYKSYYDNPYSHARKFFNEIDAHPLVDYWVGYSVSEYGDDWGFSDSHCGTFGLTPVGLAFRDAGVRR